MKRKLILSILCCALLLSGCSKGSSSSYSSAPVINESADDYGLADDSLAGNHLASDGDDSEDIASTDNGSSISSSDYEASKDDISEDTSGQDAEHTTEKTEQKLVYTCDMTIETLEFDQSLTSIKKEVKKYEGIIETENQSDSNSNWYSSSSKSYGTLSSYLVIRIPAEKYEAFLEDLSGNGKILSKNMNVSNISKHYTEVQTTIQSLETQEKRLLTLMEKASSVDDMIKVESRLTEVENELAQYKNTLASLDTDVTYSTINLTINEVVQYQAQSDTFTDRFLSTINDSKNLFLSFLESSLFAMILFGPIILVLAVILLLLVKIIRKFVRVRKNKKKTVSDPKSDQKEMKQRLPFSKKNKEE